MKPRTLPFDLYPPRMRNQQAVFLYAMRHYARHLSNLIEHVRGRR